MILAESETTLGQLGVFITLVLTGIGALITVIVKARSDSSYKKEKAELEKYKLEIQIQQRDAIRAVEVQIGVQNGKLSTVMADNNAHYNAHLEVSAMRHQQLLDGFKSCCHGQPVQINQIVQPPNAKSSTTTNP